MRHGEETKRMGTICVPLLASHPRYLKDRLLIPSESPFPSLYTFSHDYGRELSYKTSSSLFLIPFLSLFSRNHGNPVQ
uniref:Ovule protein n=1 Tax=Caenorhabditis tropicalis TaxID=1561998 RepID=A0A1I7U924_9PELO